MLSHNPHFSSLKDKKCIIKFLMLVNCKSRSRFKDRICMQLLLNTRFCNREGARILPHEHLRISQLLALWCFPRWHIVLPLLTTLKS